MSYFEYEAIYLGIIVGLALANILTSLHKLIEAGKRVRWSWMAPGTAAYAATHTVNEFWFTWVYHQNDPGQTVFTWYANALAFALLFLMCAAALPDDAADGDVDLERFYIDNRKRFWGFSAALHALNLASWLKGFVLAGFALPFLHSSALPMLANTGEGLLSLSLMFTRAKWWHALVLVLLWGWSLYFFGPMPLN
ncbi:MAG TPA: hypothetical protein VHL34_18880 [Rhizomicrobium sp.]|nr:hypothetical protein [Rhizomicrobium sp.]